MQEERFRGHLTQSTSKFGSGTQSGKAILSTNTLISQVENKYWIIDSNCSHHMSNDMKKFVKFKSHDGGIIRVGNNVAYHIT